MKSKIKKNRPLGAYGTDINRTPCAEAIYQRQFQRVALLMAWLEHALELKDKFASERVNQEYLWPTIAQLAHVEATFKDLVGRLMGLGAGAIERVIAEGRTE